MLRTIVTRTFALTGLVPAGKPNYEKSQQQFCHTAHQPEKRLGLPTRFPNRPPLIGLALAPGFLAIACAQPPAVTEPVLQIFGSSAGATPQAGVIRDDE